MGSVIGSITDAIGLTQHGNERKAAKLAAQASAQGFAMSKESIALAKEQLAFQKQQYTDWQGIYGDIQTNLGDYYNSLTPDKIATLGLENQQREFQVVNDSIKRDFAQRNLQNSGQETATKTNAAYSNASARAQIRTNAPKEVAAEKLKFLGVGLGQGTQLLSNIGNAASNITNSFSSGVNSRTNIAGQYLSQQTSLATTGMQNTAQILSNFSYLPGGGPKGGAGYGR